jgi:hypothetical protein
LGRGGSRCVDVIGVPSIPFLMRRLRHGVRLGGSFVSYSVTNRAWWVIPMVVLLAVIALAIVVGQAAAPYTLYTLF